MVHDVTIVSAGPAGMAAALAVAEAGFSVVVVDEQARAGGQIFRRPSEAWGERHGTYRPYTWARDLIERFEDHPGIKTHFNRPSLVCCATETDRSMPLLMLPSVPLSAGKGSHRGVSCWPLGPMTCRSRSPAGHCPV